MGFIAGNAGSTYEVPMRMGNGYLWYDDTNNEWRVKDDTPPTSETDGDSLMRSDA